MKIETSYFIKTINDVLVWLAVGAEIPEGAIIIEERPMIMPAEGMALKHKTTGAISSGHWLREGSAEDWEEIEEPKEQGAE
jgi:hypothetical protein